MRKVNQVKTRHFLPIISASPLVSPRTLGPLLGLLTLSLWILAACGGSDGATPTPVSTPLREPTEAIVGTPLAVETLPAVAAATVPPPAVLATPTVSELTVVEDDTDCSIDFDIDLAGYENLKLKMGCAVGPSNNGPVGINEFGPGAEYDRFMLWFGAEQEIYVLFPDRTWQSYRDTWDESQPEFSCNPLNVAPSSPPLPRRGFGKLWCSVEGLQDQLGAIEREERLCQHVIVQPFEQGRMVACFEDATIRYFRLLNDGTWDLQVVQ